MNHISLKTMIVMQTHTLHRRCFSHDQLAASSAIYTGVTGRWGMLSHAQNTVRWLVSSKRSVCIKQSKGKLVPANLATVFRFQFYVS